MMRQIPWPVLAGGALLVFADHRSADGHDALPVAIAVEAANPLAQARFSATVVLHLDEIRRLALSLAPAKTVVVDAKGSELLSQLVDMDGDELADDLVFQGDFAPRERKLFTLQVGTRRVPEREEYRVYGRFVRERHDDFAWENDRSPDVADAAAWARLVEKQQREAMTPLQVSLRLASPAVKASAGAAPTGSQATRMLESVIARAPSVLTDKWEYDTGLVLRGIEQVALKTKNAAALAYVKRTIDGLVDKSGTIKGYRQAEYNIDNINMGRGLFRLWAEAQPVEKQRYRKAIELLRSQMRTHPRTDDGAFWHKWIYPRQMWLDGVYMASPFLAQYAATFHEPSLFDDVTRQIMLAEEHMRDKKTGLLYHGWDEQRRERWANPKTGCSSQFWGRAMGWYAMAVVDVLEWLPPDHPRRLFVLAVLTRLAAALAYVQDPVSGTWWQVLDQAGRPGNYRESSASSMFVYALAKGVRNGWLDRAVYAPVAARGYQGLVREFVELGPDGNVNLKNVCKMAGLGGNPYRDGSYAYYTSTEVVKNDPKGLGAFLLAAVENE